MAESMIKQNLDRILEKRHQKESAQKAKAEALTRRWKESHEKLTCICSEFSKLQPEEQLTVCGSEDAAWMAGLPDRIQEADLAFQDAAGKLNALAARYGRSTVNLVVIGAMGSGKSKFLQSASGLGDECIPSYPGGSCTGVTSIIENRGGATQALFTFKTEEEALEVMRREIARFAHRIKAEDQITESASFDEGAGNLEKLREILNPPGREALEKLTVIDEASGIERPMADADRNDMNGLLNSLLELYKDHRKDWVSYLGGVGNEKLDGDLEPEGGGRYILRKQERIREYVSKHNGDGTRYYLHAAIKKAVIWTQFKNGIDARIRLIDTVGIGDPGVDTEERMMEAVNDNADGVIFLLEGRSRYEGFDIRDRELIEKFQEVYHTYSSRESVGDGAEKKTRYWMSFLINNRFKDALKEDHCQKYLEETVVKSYNGKSRLFGPEGIVYRKAINVGDPKEVRDMIGEFLQQISDNLQEIDSGMETSAAQAEDLALALDEALRRRLGRIRINRDRAIELNYIDQLYKERIGGLKKNLIDLREEIAKAREKKGPSDSFLQQSLQKVRTLEEDGTLQGFFFAPGQEANLKNMIQYYYHNKDSESYSTSFPNARLAVLQALRNVIREIGARPLEDQAKTELVFKRQVANACLDSLKLNQEKLKDNILDKPDVQDADFFEKLAQKLTDGLTGTDEIRKAFLSMDQFKLDKSNGITKALFDHFAAEHFVDAPYATPKVFPEHGDTDGELFLQELKECLGDFIDSIDERTSKVVYVRVEDGASSGAENEELVTVNGKTYRKELQKEAYLIDEDEQKIHELENFIHIMEPMHKDAWKSIISRLLKLEFLTEDVGRRKRLAIVDAVAEELESRRYI